MVPVHSETSTNIDCFFKGVAAVDTQELLKTPSPDSSMVDGGIAQKMFAALESEGMFHHN